MVKNDTNVDDKNKNDLASFETLDQDTDGEDKENKADQLKAALALLKEKLSAEDYKAVTATFGIKTELTNEDVLDTILAHLKEMAKKPEDEEEDEYEYPKPKTKKGADPSFQEYVKSCMKGGKDMAECSAEFKEKYKDKVPDKKEEAEVATLALKWAEEFKKPEEDEDKEKDPDKLQEIIKDLKERVGVVEERARLAEIGNEVDQLVHDKHAAPIQKESILKLGAAMTPEMKDDFFKLFRTQKYNVAEDAGKLQSGRPGEGLEIDDETRARILRTHGLNQLIEDKGVGRANN